MTHPYWPLFDLRLRTPRLELRPASDDDLVELVGVAKAGIHPAERMPFIEAWTDIPSPEFERNFLKHWWAKRAGWTVDAWTLNLVVLHDGAVIGSQGLHATDFPVTREVKSGSWLGQPFQRQGFGKEMRAAVLALAFDGLGAIQACSGAFEESLASQRVSEALGYRRDGSETHSVRGERVTEVRYVVTRDDRDSNPYCDVTIEGLEACLDMFGLG